MGPSGAPHSLPAWLAVAKAAGVGAGKDVLDVGCGTGGFCEVAVAAGASASGVDVDEQALAVARRRVPAGDFRAGRMEALPWSDGRFDVVAGVNAFQYAQDPALALVEARRVARAGGAVAVCKWAAPQDNELFTVLRAVVALTGRAPPPARSADAFGALAPAIHGAGLEVLMTGEVPVVLEFAGATELEAALQATGALGGVRDRLGDEALGRELRRAAAPYAQPDGSYRLENVHHYLVARA